MRFSIGKRLFIALTIGSLLIVAINAIATRWSFQRGFSEYVMQQESERLTTIVRRLAGIYRRNESWKVLQENPRTWDELFRGPGGAPPERRLPEGNKRPPPPADPLVLRARVSLEDAVGALVVGRPMAADEAVKRHAIMEGDTLVGTLLVRAPDRLTGQLDLAFAREQNRSTLVIGVVVLLLAAAMAALLARQMEKPIAALTAGARALADGDFERRITVARDDELGDLASDFNALAMTLARNQRARRQWVSDISHELRTPLAILSGELQALEDGVRAFDSGTRQSLQSEVNRLARLVNDLHELTVSDEGQPDYCKEAINIGVLLGDTLSASRSRLEGAGLSITLTDHELPLYVAGDASRLAQLFSNVLENSLRYTDAPGMMSIRLTALDKTVEIEFADSAPGVTSAQLERLFDRLYRVERSRSRATGGSGLGLSICAAIVSAHGGEISAQKSLLGGVAIRISLPRTAAPERSA